MWSLWKSLVLAFILHFTLVNCNEHSYDLYEAVPNAFFKDCLLEINRYRRLHSAFALRWSNDLQYHAQLRADELAKDKFLVNDLEALDRLGQGETVSYLSPFHDTCRTYPPSGICYACRETIATWYNESKHYNYQTGYSKDGTKPVLDFTQLVWKDSVKVGVATAISPRYGLITVARFHPRGNIGFVDDYVRNVAPRGTISDGFDADRRRGGPSCRKLRKRKADRDCFNAYGNDLCDFYVKRFRGYCFYNVAFMKRRCAKSCKFCEKRFPAPPAIENEVQKKLGLTWVVSKWFECHGGFQWRSVKCYHKHNGHDFLVQNKFCRHQLGEKPAQYKDCPYF